eukprot:1156692-Pelagomonas_calceolata.AAC.6
METVHIAEPPKKKNHQDCFRIRETPRAKAPDIFITSKRENPARVNNVREYSTRTDKKGNDLSEELPTCTASQEAGCISPQHK